MTGKIYHIAQPEGPFARTNRQTIIQRARLLLQLGYDKPTIAEICCGDCRRQQQLYHELLRTKTYYGLDISPAVVALNQANGVACVLGDALDVDVMHQFAAFDVLFFGPPLSVHCDGHSGLSFPAVTPGFVPFAQLLLHELLFAGLLVCICPNSTNMGDIRRLYGQVQRLRPDVGLRLIHHSYATMTGADKATEMRLKYVELWFSTSLDDLWEVRESRGI